jgi:hypothetical protein
MSDLRRRQFITLLGGAAVAWPLAARAQQQPVRPLIGILSPLSAASAARNIAAFRSGLRDLAVTWQLGVKNSSAPRPAGRTDEVIE